MKFFTKTIKSRKIKEVFSNPPEIHTTRILARKIILKDYKDMFEYSSDPDVTKYLTWYPHKTVSETLDYIQYLQKRYADGKFYDWALILKETGKMIGTCGFTTINLYQNKAEVGYVLAKNYWGMGLMPEILHKVIEFGFDVFDFDKVEARFMDGNERSKNVMLKMGMTLEVTHEKSLHVKGDYKTIHTYSIIREKFV